MDDNFGIIPGAVYRKNRGAELFGLGKSQIDPAIKNGLIPPPFEVYPGSRAKVWTGTQIIQHRRAQLAAAHKAAAEEGI
jgi:hypothetical protein